MALVVLWIFTYPLLGDFDTWQIVLSAVTSAITFLLVALLQNAHTRSQHALQCKLDALAEGLADLMKHLDDEGQTDLSPRIEELKTAVGLQERVSGKDVLAGERMVDGDEACPPERQPAPRLSRAAGASSATANPTVKTSNPEVES